MFIVMMTWRRRRRRRMTVITEVEGNDPIVSKTSLPLRPLSSAELFRDQSLSE